METVVVAHGQAIVEGRKTAILTAATIQDQYSMDGLWNSVNDGWDHGIAVDAVQHFGRHQLATFDIIKVEALETMHPVCLVRIDEIRMMDCAALEDGEITALGYDSREEFMSEFMSDWANRRGWYMDITFISER